MYFPVDQITLALSATDVSGHASRSSNIRSTSTFPTIAAASTHAAPLSASACSAIAACSATSAIVMHILHLGTYCDSASDSMKFKTTLRTCAKVTDRESVTSR